MPLDTLLKGTGAGTVDDTATVVRPRPCTCPCTDPKYAKQSTKKPANTEEPTSTETEGQAEDQVNKEKRRSTEPEKGPAGPGTAIDPHDGCPTCGGGGSARYLGTDGKPISAATVRRLACEADLIPVVLGGDGQVLDLGRSDRFFKEHQRRALAIRDGHHCNFPGCQIPEPRCITHHMTAWDHGGPTDLANGVLLCRHHHVTIHHKGWQVRMGTHGHPEYTPPEWSDPQRRILRP
ncbi:HNH endonuclease [Actinopolymorpha singaporensis]|uniref:HNH endonuclease n=1 Tax=Actinopolymorpha singaporensis TaxID=117157 RepID=UPI0024118C77|nr:HNH endonuclease signature motif containing protein [Actinopolymorpha singaporensis]